MRPHIRRPALLVVAALAIGSGIAITGTAPAFAATEDIPPSLSILSAGNAGVVVTAAGLIYVADAPANLIDIYDANGGYLGDIYGTHTGLSGPTGLAVDSSGNVYAANQGDNSITVYSASARNDANPSRDITGGDTNLDGVRGVAVDSAGHVYATDYPANEVTIYAPAATDDAVPIATIGGGGTQLDGPYGAALDPTTGILYVSNLLGGTVSEYTAPLTSPVSPVRVISGLASPLGVAVDASGNVFAANYTANSVNEYDPTADGPATPTTTIAGASTTLNGPAGLFVDPAGDVFVTSATSISEAEFSPAPTITAVSPRSGPTTGGTTVTVTGTGFGPTTELDVDGVPTAVSGQTATGLSFVSATHGVGAVDLVVTTLGGTVTAADGFTYNPVLATTGVDPTVPLEIGASLLALGIVVVVVAAIIRRVRRRKPDAHPKANQRTPKTGLED
jgi:hypothetical protein